MVNITQNIDDCVKSILEGDVVAFPTETVYGLGANIYDENAVNKIYKYKNRPKNLPLIVHVDSYEKMIKLVNIEDKHLIIFKHLCEVKQNISKRNFADFFCKNWVTYFLNCIFKFVNSSF